MSRNQKQLKVCAYRKDGRLYRVFDSAKEASIRRGHPRTVDKCLRGDSLTAFGYYWRRFPLDEIPEKIEINQKEETTTTKSPIALVNESGELIKCYPSIKSAALENNVDPHSIRDVLNGKYSSAKGKKYRRLRKEEAQRFGFDFGTEINNKKKAVLQYTLNGEYVKTYSSINAALKSLGKASHNQGIHQCLNGTYSTAFGYVWKYKEKTNQKRPLKRRTVLVCLEKKSKKVIQKFSSTKEASLSMKISVSSINNCLRGRQKTAGGYLWIKSKGK